MLYRKTRGKCDGGRDKRALQQPNGDRWFLSPNPAGYAFIRHEANAPSGGQVTDIDIGVFLNRGPRNPEHQALLRLIGTLIEGSADIRSGAALGG
jgi:hypothetical protein